MQQDIKAILDKVKLFLFDMDGTVYVAGRAIPGAFETVEFIKKQGKKICFLTNNSSIPQHAYVDKLKKGYGFDITENEIFSSLGATVEYLHKYHEGKSVYLVATKAVCEEVAKSGIILTEENPDIVIVAFDLELTYKKLETACRYIERGAFYIATHPDTVCPFYPADLPDVGSFIELIYAVTKRRPDLICGKPYEAMAQSIMNKFNLKPEEIAMVGDRLYTDVQFGINNGFVSILVLTGETTRAMLESYLSKPTLVFDSLSHYKKFYDTNF